MNVIQPNPNNSANPNPQIERFVSVNTNQEKTKPLDQIKSFFSLIIDKIGSNNWGIVIISVVLFVGLMSVMLFLTTHNQASSDTKLTAASKTSTKSKLSSLLGNLDSEEEQKQSPTIAPTSAIKEETTPTAKPESPTLKPSKTPTPKPSSTPTPQPSNTPIPTPTPTTRQPNPPKIKITFPTSGQVVTSSNSDYTLCVVDVPDGGDWSGASKRTNIDNAGWSSFQSPSTTCFKPTDGNHTIAIQYKNQYGEEGNVVTVSYSYKYENPNQCSDSDNGRVFMTKGVTSSSSDKLCPENRCDKFCSGSNCTDSCAVYVNGNLTLTSSTNSGAYILEWWCDGSRTTYEVRTCDSGRCSDGACLP